MTLDALKLNLNHTKEIIRELYVFTNQLLRIEKLERTTLSVIDANQKKLLIDSINSLTIQLITLNSSIPGLLDRIKFYKGLKTDGKKIPETIPKEKFVQIKFKPLDKEEVTLVIDKKFKKKFLENLSKSNLSITKLKKKFSVTPKPASVFGKTNYFAKFSNIIFRKTSKKIIDAGYLNDLNKNLRKINSQFLIGTYVSMILLISLVGLLFGIGLFVTLLFFDISLLLPFFTLTSESILTRIIKFIVVIPLIPIFAAAIMVIYPKSEAKSMTSKINQEIPFLTIHMAAIASSGIRPIGIFQILLKNSEYKHSNKSLRKIMNLINFYGLDVVTALKEAALSSPSIKLRELLDGMATSITSGGDLHQYLENRSERLLFDYKLEREKYIKISETFMNLYISIVIAAPMIFLMLFVIIGGTGMLSNLIGLDINSLSILIVLIIVLLNIGFLVFLKMKQPSI